MFQVPEFKSHAIKVDSIKADDGANTNNYDKFEVSQLLDINCTLCV
jgi:hypothetical protein